MASELRIRRTTPDDTDRILDLVRLSLGEGKIPRHIDYWTWKHSDNHFGSSPGLLAESNGLLVGLRVFMRWSWCGQGATWPAVRAVDTATHPEWRGRGIFSRLTLALLEQMKAEGITFVFNTPNRQSRPGYLKMGWVSVGRTSLWVRPVRPLKLVHSLLLSRNSDNATWEADLGVQGGAPTSELLHEPGFSQFLDALPDRNDRFSTPLSSEYFRWRYVAIPGFAYRAAWSLDGDDGAVVVYRFKDDREVRELRFCEVLVKNTKRSRQMGQQLVRGLVSGADVHYASAMAVIGTPEQRILLRCGFLPAPRVGPVMTVRPLNRVTKGLDPLRRSNWRLSIGDLELF